MRSRHQQVAWDNILIDEAQDWSEIEKAVIFRIFGKNKVIIADGVDQLIRTQKKCNWQQGLKPNADFIKTTEKKGLRQKTNLVSFVNSYARNLGIAWEIEPERELIGGKVIISLNGYEEKLHNKELARCKEKGNTEYEMMFLVPPKLVKREKSKNKFGQITKTGVFKLKNDFESMGIKIWDGTNTDLRTQYVVDLDQHRLLQYESCRGLEGWTVVCLEIDEFINYKMDTYEEEATGKLALYSFEEERDEFVYLWSLIPLTRAIDTLVITLNKKDSKVGQALRRAYEQNPDFVQWIE